MFSLLQTGEADYDPETNTVVVLFFEACATGFGYLWNETPVLGTEALPIYSDNEFRLPAAPWKIEIERCQCYKTFYARNLQIFIIS
jgi:hypothetical protein